MLLEKCKQGSILLGTQSGALLAEDVFFAVPPSLRAEPGDLPARAHAVLSLASAAGLAEPVLVGAIPFDPRADVHLVVPRTVHRAPSIGIPVPGTVAGLKEARAIPAEADYARSVGDAVRRVRAGDFDKVVLARSLRLDSPQRIDPAQLLSRLAEQNPGANLFAVSLGGDRTLVGASPELLLSRHGQDVATHPLAGSVPRSADPAGLLRSKKDLREHRLVVEAIEAVLRALCASVDVPREPSLVATGAMWHLGTRITARIADPADPAVSALALATALHPTPAVCGSPAPLARAAIADYEQFDRGFYTGMVGWSDLPGDGEWAVTIRCAVIEPDGLTLYAGAGVVAESDPAAELAETSAKFRTLLNVLGV